MERKSRKIGIIGHFGGKENILDGQTIKTKILHEELSKATDWKIIKVDTYYKKKNPIKLLIDTFKCLFSTKDIIVLLSGNGMKFYFPILSFFAQKFHTNIYHDVIGGNLDLYVSKYPKFKKYLNSFQINWVETAGMKDKLENQAIKNCEVMPNFKRLSIADREEEIEFSEPYRFCIFSRVMKEKGIEDAIDAIQSINEDAGRVICSLDIYGRIDDGYAERFEEVLKNVTEAIQYKGMVPYDKSVEAIKDYYALLFPTYWDGEGFPGTIVDAFSAGLPVVATDCNCNAEIIVNKENGILYPNEEIRNLTEAIKWMLNNKDSINELKSNCLISAKKYQPDEYIKKIVNVITES